MHRHATVAHTLDGLLQLANDGCAGAAVLTGAPGLGKTLVRSALQQQCDANRCAVVAVESGLLEFDDLLLETLSQLRGERLLPNQLPGRYERIAELKAVLASDIAATGRHVLLLLDDADQYSPATLQSIGTLLNLSSEQRTFIVPVLVGAPALRHTIARLPALRQRIGAQYTLASLESGESAEYIQHRLRLAGLETSDVFAPGVLHRLQTAAGGVPRVLNGLCRNAIQHAATHRRPVVSADCVLAAIALQVEPGATLSALAIGQ
jgi:general secretion pathway protein A